KKKPIKYAQLQPKYLMMSQVIDVGEAPRAHPKGLAHLPNIYNLERYRLQKEQLDLEFDE
ncbi:hypothetical protein, partial [Desulfobacterium sp. N47]|uniref:hypothetical protein n=1 Tax=Desulfobacterium sp. N47 TaxID=3115210 RepID=UPI003F4A15A1